MTETMQALVVQEPTALFAEGDSSRGLDQWDVPLLLLAPFGDYSLVPDALEPYLTSAGPRSIRAQFVAEIEDAEGVSRAAASAEPMLGLIDGTRAYLDRMDGFGPRQSSDGTQLAGVVLHLVVRTSG